MVFHHINENLTKTPGMQFSDGILASHAGLHMLRSQQCEQNLSLNWQPKLVWEELINIAHMSEENYLHANHVYNHMNNCVSLT